MIDCMNSSMRMRDFGASKASKTNYILLFAGVVVGFVCYAGIT